MAHLLQLGWTSVLRAVLFFWLYPREVGRRTSKHTLERQ